MFPLVREYWRSSSSGCSSSSSRGTWSTLERAFSSATSWLLWGSNSGRPAPPPTHHNIGVTVAVAQRLPRVTPPTCREHGLRCSAVLVPESHVRDWSTKVPPGCSEGRVCPVVARHHFWRLRWGRQRLAPRVTAYTAMAHTASSARQTSRISFNSRFRFALKQQHIMVCHVTLSGTTVRLRAPGAHHS